MTSRSATPTLARTPLAALLLAALVGLSATAQAQVAPPAGSTVKRGEPMTLNFVNADIEAVARTLGAATGRNVVVDPRVKGTITLTTDAPIAPAAAYGQFLASLRMQGYTVVHSDGLDKVVPEADARLQGGTVAEAVPGDAAKGAAGSQLMTQIIRLQHENANNLVNVLRPLVGPNTPINVNPGTNTLVITDYADNLRRLARIIAALDVPSATDVEIITLKHASAADLAPLVQRLTESTTAAVAVPNMAVGGDLKTSVVAETRANALIVRAANQAKLAQVRALVDKLDQPLPQSGNGAAGNIYVVYLKNANAVQLAATLRAAISGEARNAPSAGSAASTGSTGTSSTPTSTALAASAATANQASTGGQIQADPSTNALIITASEPQYRQLRAVIDKLDARRAQVYVESLIAEVNTDRAAEFGIQWQNALGKAGDGTIGVLGTNFGSGGNNILNLAIGAATGTVLPGKGLNVGAVNNTNGVYTLGFLARFLESSGSGNVLSTPNIVTLDNEEATIKIGQKVPFVTGQFTNTGASNGSVNPFQTIERQDVGLKLKIKPQISENGSIKLVVEQEVSSVLATTANAANGPTVNQRTINSTVLVEDGQVAVLGGLIQDEYAGNEEKLPGLGNIPVLGLLFKNESRSRKRTNLMIFLRPVVVRDAAANERLATDRYESMRNGQQSAQPQESVLVPINEAPVMPALPAPNPAASRSTPKGP